MDLQKELTERKNKVNNVMIDIDNMKTEVMNINENEPDFIIKASVIDRKLRIAEEYVFKMLLETIEFDSRVRNQNKDINEFIQRMTSNNNQQNTDE